MANYVSANFIISSVGRKFGIDTTKYKVQMYESIGNAVSRLDIRTDKVTKYLITKVDNFMIHKPNGLLNVISLMSEGKFVNNKDLKQTKSVRELFVDVSELMRVYKATQRGAEIMKVDRLCEIPTDVEERLLMVFNGHVETYEAFHTQVQNNTQRNYWWQENEHTIKTNFVSDEVIVQYQAVRTDDEGYPTIVDEQKLIEYVEYYVLRDIMFSGYKHPVLQLADVNTLMEKAEARAVNQFRRRTPMQMELFMRVWTNQLNYVRKDFYSNTVNNQFDNYEQIREWR